MKGDKLLIDLETGAINFIADDNQNNRVKGVLMQSEEKVIDVEGCLSFKDIFVKVERPKVIEVQYETTKGKTRFARLDGMESKCFQHEHDHLEGVTFNQRVSKLRWQMANK